MKLEDLKLFPHPLGFQHKELFDNGYGISVIPEYEVGEGALYEVAVLSHNEGKHAHPHALASGGYVFRFCTVDAVDTLIERIRSLPKAE